MKSQTNVFTTATSITAPVVKKSKKVTREEIDLGTALDKLASFAVIEKLLKNEAEIHRAFVKDKVIKIFADAGATEGKKPESFVGFGERAKASCELRKRGSNMPLTAEVMVELDRFKVPYEKLEVIPERYVFNPNLDKLTMERISKLITNDPVLKTQQIVMRQEEQVKYVVGDNTLDAVANLPVATQEMIMEKVATIAIGKFEFDDAKIEENHQVTGDAKAIALSILQDLEVLPKPEVVEIKRKRKAA